MKKVIKPIPRYFPVRIRVEDPLVISPRQEANREGCVFEHKRLKGFYMLVSPSCPMEIFHLRMMEHRTDKFAPAQGNGVIVTDAALARIDA